jgi:hypothetical protein
METRPLIVMEGLPPLTLITHVELFTEPICAWMNAVPAPIAVASPVVALPTWPMVITNGLEETHPVTAYP